MTDKDQRISDLEKRIKQLEHEKAIQENSNSYSLWNLHFATDRELSKALEELRMLKGE